MNTEPSAEESILLLPEPSGREGNPSNIRGIFVGSDGIRAGWRFAIFLALLAIFRQLIIQHGLRLIPGFVKIAKATQASGILTPQFQLTLQSAAILTVFLAAGVMGMIEKQTFEAYGLPRQGVFGKLFWQGGSGVGIRNNRDTGDLRLRRIFFWNAGPCRQCVGKVCVALGDRVLACGHL